MVYVLFWLLWSDGAGLGAPGTPLPPGGGAGCSQDSFQAELTSRIADTAWPGLPAVNPAPWFLLVASPSRVFSRSPCELLTKSFWKSRVWGFLDISMDQNGVGTSVYDADWGGALPAPRNSDPEGLGGPGAMHFNMPTPTATVYAATLHATSLSLWIYGNKCSFWGARHRAPVPRCGLPSSLYWLRVPDPHGQPEGNLQTATVFPVSQGPGPA